MPAGLLSGYLLGACVGRFAIWLRPREPDNHAPNDLLLLALICTTYFAAEQMVRVHRIEDAVAKVLPLRVRRAVPRV